MISNRLIYGISLFCCSFTVVFAEAEHSKIEEEMLLNPLVTGGASDKVMIYSRVRDKTIHKAMNTQFHRIETMMFVYTIVESDLGVQSYTDDDDCD